MIKNNDTKILVIGFGVLFILFISSIFLLSTPFQEDNQSYQNDFDVINQTCSPCPEYSWSECDNFEQYRLKYYCDSSTNYQCFPKRESQACIPISESNNYILREYKWVFKNTEWRWRIIYPNILYEYYQNQPRRISMNYAIYVTDPYDNEIISKIVNSTKDIAKQNGFNEWDTVHFIASFVQSLPYTYDNITTPFDEYPRYAIETLVDNGGDCEDTSILVATLLKEFGYKVKLIYLPGHMAVGIKCDESVGAHYKDSYGNNYCYLETTSEGFEIGDIPDEYLYTEAIIVDIELYEFLRIPF